MGVRAGHKHTTNGMIPDDWTVTPLGDLIMGSPDYGINAPAVAYADKLPAYLRITDISTEGRYLQTGKVSVNSSQSEAYYLADGDIVFARTGASVGKSYQYHEKDGPLVFAGFLIRVKPDINRVVSSYIYAFCNSNPYWSWVRLMSMRSGQPGINGREYSQLPIPLPPLPEQQAIARALGDVDDLIASLDKLIAKKRDLKQASMQQLLTGKTRLQGFNGEWETKRIGQLVAIRNIKLNTNGNSIASFCVELEQIAQGSGQIFGHSDASDRNSVKYHFQKGDVLFGRLRPYLRKFWWADCEGVCSTEIWPLVPIAEQLTSGFLFQTVKTEAFIEAANSSYGTHMPRSDWNALKQFELRFPTTINEQNAIVDILSDMDAEITELEQRRDKTIALKQGMMQELLTGRTRLV
jgi:type I restriction enzyme S subunit